MVEAIKSGAQPSAIDAVNTDREHRFRVLAELGEGGMAKVHLAAARGPNGFNKLVVLKTLRSDQGSDPECVEMFLHEGRLAARLNHPNVVQTFEVTVDADRPGIVMEYLEGESLSRLLTRARKERRLPLAMHVRILCEALAGLHYAHELQDFDGTKFELVHRDVSPQNVFVTFEGQVKVLDFGIAKVAVSAPSRTEAGVLKGKVRYMAPEQMAGNQVDRRADIFSVGAMLWEALAGQRIWSGVTDVAVIQRLLAGEIPSPQAFDPNVSERLERICLKAMAFRREDRFDTAREFEMELEAALADEDVVRQRDIGSFVAELFADVRAEIKGVIERQMSRAANLSPREFEAVAPVSLYGLTQSSTASGSTESRRREPIAAESKATVLVRLGVVLLTLVFIFGSFAALVWRGARRPVPGEGQASTGTIAERASAAPIAGEPRPLGSLVELRIAATPAQARVFFDDEALASNPSVLSRGLDHSTHHVRAEAPRYIAQTIDVSLDKSASILVALERDEAAAPASIRPVSNQRTPPATLSGHAGGPPAPAQNVPSACAQPYYFDGLGIKRIRSECL